MRTRFLIVDDSELVRRSLRMVLQANPDWEICGEAGDGVSAVEMFKELRPSVRVYRTDGYLALDLPDFRPADLRLAPWRARPSAPLPSGICCVMQWMLPPPSRISRAGTPTTWRRGNSRLRRAAARRSVRGSSSGMTMPPLAI